MPNGYFGMYLLSYFPKLWFNAMDQRVLDLPHIQGDLSKVNIDPRKVDYYQNLYGTREESEVETTEKAESDSSSRD